MGAASLLQIGVMGGAGDAEVCRYAGSPDADMAARKSAPRPSDSSSARIFSGLLRSAGRATSTGGAIQQGSREEARTVFIGLEKKILAGVAHGGDEAPSGGGARRIRG